MKPGKKDFIFLIKSMREIVEVCIPITKMDDLVFQMPWGYSCLGWNFILLMDTGGNVMSDPFKRPVRVIANKKNRDVFFAIGMIFTSNASVYR